MPDSKDSVEVICAWPVSSQYGPGSRVLYYILILACVFARKIEWLRNAALAAALLLPAVAALHGIFLAAMHVENAVDMDIYGAFQFCAIGVIIAPVTVRMSKTYFYDPARNAIFLWLGLVLAGLLSLTVEFYRAHPRPCYEDQHNNPIPLDVGRFPYGNFDHDDQKSCNLTCSTSLGPFSPMRGGSANNIYIIPTPSILPFGVATLLSTACCLHALLWLISMWDKILEINWRNRRSKVTDEEEAARADEQISGTNGATKKRMGVINDMIKVALGLVVIPIFFGAGLAILIVGELNFFSDQVQYQTEPMASIGQWGTIAGTLLATLGSLFIVFARDVSPSQPEPSSATNTPICNCQRENDCPSPTTPRSHDGRISFESIDVDGILNRRPRIRSPPEKFPTLETSNTRTTAGTEPQRTDGGRRAVRGIALWINKRTMNWNAGFDADRFQSGQASEFPVIPGEEGRNPELAEKSKAWGNRTPSIHQTRSRTSSFISETSEQGLNGGLSSPSLTTRRDTDDRFPSPKPLSRQHANTLPVRERPSQILPGLSSSRAGSSSRHRNSDSPIPGRARRRDTLQVPPNVHPRQSSHRNSASEFSRRSWSISPRESVGSVDDGNVQFGDMEVNSNRLRGSDLPRPEISRRRDTLEVPPEILPYRSRNQHNISTGGSNSTSPLESALSINEQNPDAGDAMAMNQEAYDKSS